MTKPIERLLDDARVLLREAGQHPVGGLWRDRLETWVEESAEWVTGYHEHQGELTETKLDPGVEGRVSNLEQAMVSLAVSVAGLQTLALQGSAAPGPPPTQWEMAQQLEPDREVELLDGSKIKLKDVPLDRKTGQPEEEWAMKNCPCEVHNEKRRRAKGEAEAEPADPATGMYL